MVFFDEKLHSFLLIYDEALPSFILAGQGLLVKMLIAFEPHHICPSSFAELYIFEIDRENDKEKKKNSHAWI